MAKLDHQSKLLQGRASPVRVSPFLEWPMSIIHQHMYCKHTLILWRGWFVCLSRRQSAQYRSSAMQSLQWYLAWRVLQDVHSSIPLWPSNRINSWRKSSRSYFNQPRIGTSYNFTKFAEESEWNFHLQLLFSPLECSPECQGQRPLAGCQCKENGQPDQKAKTPTDQKPVAESKWSERPCVLYTVFWSSVNDLDHQTGF